MSALGHSINNYLLSKRKEKRTMKKEERIEELYECNYCGNDVVEDDVYYCEQCGQLICIDCACFDDDGWQTLCPDCYEEVLQKRELIADYHEGARLAPVQTLAENLTAKPFAGVGLETEVVGLDNYECLRAVKTLLNDYCTFERDCTVSVEMISAPLSFAYLKKNADKYRRAFEMLRAGGYDTNHQCGAHVHFSRECFGENTAEQNETIAKILSFYSLFSAEMVELAERQDTYYCESLSRSPLEYKNGERAYGHYTAVNCENSATIEFRLLQGTLDFDKVYNWILFHKGLIERAKTISWDKVGNAGFWTSTLTCEGVPVEMVKRFLDLVRKYHGATTIEICGYQPHFFNADGEEITLVNFPVHDSLYRAQREAYNFASAFNINGAYFRTISETEYRLYRESGEEYAKIVIEKSAINWD